MKTHDLKTWPEYFEAVVSGEKTFEIRRDDRGFSVGDRLHLIEWDPATSGPTGRSASASVSFLLKGGRFGLQDDHVVLALENVRRTDGGAPQHVLFTRSCAAAT